MRCGTLPLLVLSVVLNSEIAVSGEISGSPAAGLSVGDAAVPHPRRLFFNGRDTQSFGIWHTSGTIATTVEVGGPGSKKVPNFGDIDLVRSMSAFGSGILFSRQDTSNYDGLWYSDGTVAGTIEIGGVKGAGITNAGPNGLVPTQISTFGTKALFLGFGKFSAAPGVWATDGTAAGTVLLDLAKHAYVGGLNSSADVAGRSAALGDKMIFCGRDEVHFEGLWSTDGTIAGTVEFGGLQNSKIPAMGGTGCAFASFVGVDTSVYFTHLDPANKVGLWVTDGTASGTREVGGTGNKGISSLRQMDRLLGKLGSRIAFSAYDTKAYDGLWISDGTIKNTYQIGLAPSLYSNITEFSSRGGSALFIRQDSITHENTLWFTNGTRVGTKNLKRATYSKPEHVTLISGNLGIFTAYDASGSRTLWATDGTVAGTKEIGGLNNRYVKGAYRYGLDESDIVATDGAAYFHAHNFDGMKQLLWITDGTATGTHPIAPTGLFDSTTLTWAP